MPFWLSQRLLTLLQFTRFALVFTAISNGQASMLLWARSMAGPDGDYTVFLEPRAMIWMAVVSICLYAFGMTLNDIIDRRRDATTASDRPLPSGRLGLGTAHIVCMMLLACGCLAGVLLSRELPRGSLSLILLAGVATLIIFYDLAGKYLISLGLITLGLIRFFHASLPAPTMPMPWHPILLLNHVTLISLVAYAWEQKRPTLTRRHVAITLSGLAAANALMIAALSKRFHDRPGDWLADLSIAPGLAWPALAAGVFVLVGLWIRASLGATRGAGKTLMLVGLLWLIVYDVSFVAAEVATTPAVLLATLFPVSYVSVKILRGWGRLIELSRKPTYMRAE
jgi:hypothetical protein